MSREIFSTPIAADLFVRVIVTVAILQLDGYAFGRSPL
jgi:hypothetical protein